MNIPAMSTGPKTAFAGLAILVLAAFLAPVLAPFDPYDATQLQLLDGKQPPAWLNPQPSQHLLGTDNQGRDLLSAILYGARISILVAALAVGTGAMIGCTLGLIAGYAGGWTDAAITRLADMQLALPGILLAMLLNGISRAAMPAAQREDFAFWVVTIAIGLAEWPQFARVVRSSTMIERGKDYVSAARILGLPRWQILWWHILPNIRRPVFVIGAIAFSLAIIAEATLSFLGQGLPATTPSLGTLIRNGNDFLYAGQWWMLTFPALFLVLMVLCANALADGLRQIADKNRP